jgi:hypothetical protein
MDRIVGESSSRTSSDATAAARRVIGRERGHEPTANLDLADSCEI